MTGDRTGDGTGGDLTGEDKVRTITDTAAGHAVRREDPGASRRRRRARIAAGLLALFLAGGATYAAVRMIQLQDQVDANARAAQLLGAQVEQLGGTPVVQPPTVDDPDPDDADPNDPEQQDPETQDPETQDAETQDLEVQEPEVQESEADDAERDDPEPDDPETQDPELQDPEIDDPPATGPPPAGWTWTDSQGREQTCTRSGGPDTAPVYQCTTAPPPDTVPPLLPRPGG